MGAWIEIELEEKKSEIAEVAPLVGAWIEIPKTAPSAPCDHRVAPLVGAWIEMKGD